MRNWCWGKTLVIIHALLIGVNILLTACEIISPLVTGIIATISVILLIVALAVIEVEGEEKIITIKNGKFNDERLNREIERIEKKKNKSKGK